MLVEDQSIIDDEDVFSELSPNTCFYITKKKANDTLETDGTFATPSTSLQFANSWQKRLLISEGRLGLRMPLESVSQFCHNVMHLNLLLLCWILINLKYQLKFL